MQSRHGKVSAGIGGDVREMPTLIVQNAFPITRLGVVTSATTFFRSIGGTVGVAILGPVVNNRFQSQLVTELGKLNPQMASRLPAGSSSQLNPQALVNPQAVNGSVLQDGGQSLHRAGDRRA